ncbi:hypothetical protein [Novosphingobium sp.]|uniref:hypothetical protein n=1 Tax=Novosphingobium sp. TaxID=1874826 RepID=UPI0025FA7AF5|nr:hypothetical protein [Novosphingobium sp.]
MDLDALLLHFFGTDDPETLTATEFDRAAEQMKVAFGVEREPGRKFALWTLLHAFDMAPLPAEAFAKEPELRAAADEYMSAAFRLERFGDSDG